MRESMLRVESPRRMETAEREIKSGCTWSLVFIKESPMVVTWLVEAHAVHGVEMCEESVSEGVDFREQPALVPRLSLGVELVGWVCALRM